MYIYIYITRTPPVGAGRVPRRYVDDVGEGAPRRDHRHDHVVLRAVRAIRVMLSESCYPSHAAARRVRGHDVMATLSCALYSAKRSQRAVKGIWPLAFSARTNTAVWLR